MAALVQDPPHGLRRRPAVQRAPHVRPELRAVGQPRHAAQRGQLPVGQRQPCAGPPGHLPVQELHNPQPQIGMQPLHLLAELMVLLAVDLLQYDLAARREPFAIEDGVFPVNLDGVPAHPLAVEGQQPVVHAVEPCVQDRAQHHLKPCPVVHGIKVGPGLGKPRQVAVRCVGGTEGEHSGAVAEADHRADAADRRVPPVLGGEGLGGEQVRPILFEDALGVQALVVPEEVLVRLLEVPPALRDPPQRQVRPEAVDGRLLLRAPDVRDGVQHRPDLLQRRPRGQRHDDRDAELRGDKLPPERRQFTQGPHLLARARAAPHAPEPEVRHPLAVGRV
mmetsp:Transcript_69875/g.116423  ORF Transcript_69875/g.116423 Transcript_69875/m.116423 type:complete len:334 (-) Transcript_69875:447-1448(-)